MTIIDLKLYKNELRIKEIESNRNDAIDSMKRAVTNIDIMGFALVAWDIDGNFKSSWSAEKGAIKPVHVPKFVEKILSINHISLDKDE